jgi:NADPH:quinone reductase-like Zn-dependent oxidoreductase
VARPGFWLHAAWESATEPESVAVHRVGWGFVSLYTLAFISTSLLFLAPLLVTLALKVNSLVGIEQAPRSLALVTGIGALLAMVGNPFFGKMSDRTSSQLGMLCAGGIAALFDVIDPDSALKALAGGPEFVWKLSLGIYPMVKGFKPSPITEEATADTTPPATSSPSDHRAGPGPTRARPRTAPEGPIMKAFVYEKYGPPETLRLAEVDKPVPDADHVLVKVRAASVNAADWHVLRGKPLFSRATLGLLRPKHQVLGVDIAGQVEAVGSGVTRFQPGDEVYANLLDHGYGGFAEYVSVPVDVMSLKPPSLSFEDAAAVPMAAVTALQGLGHHGAIQPAHKVLINGASGGVGTFAVQIAKAYGGEVTAVTSTRNLELVGSLGADHVLDYTSTDALGGGRRYDLILDTVGNRSVPDLRRALAQGGKAAVTGFTSVAGLLAVSLRGGKDIAQVQAHVTTKDLDVLSELIEAGKVRPQIDRRYRFTEIPAAIAYLEQGRARAKVVVEVG